ncbi:unnamed protein product [Polarella glacialis]|uniref:Uncharacterized protein n=1 Tax=Polarella glacialis TaxID=89957 RepID=A0A813F593_POLGL|nr:unnamed protein product [Polarella glacialis]
MLQVPFNAMFRNIEADAEFAMLQEVRGSRLVCGSARSSPAFVKTCLQGSHDGRLGTGSRSLPSIREDRDHSVASQASAVTASRTASQRSTGSQQHVGAWREVHNRPIPERPFVATTTYAEHQKDAQQARHDFYPYRDEHHPRSKRLMYEMALNKLDKGGAKSVVSDDSGSCFTATETQVSRLSDKSSATGATSVSRTSSVPSFFTADSRNVGGIGAVARRRKEALYRAPAQSDADRKWFMERYERDGPAGLTTANYPSGLYDDSFVMFSQRVAGASNLLDGARETVPREQQLALGAEGADQQVDALEAEEGMSRQSLWTDLLQTLCFTNGQFQ